MKPKTLFLISNQPNPRFIKQINFLSDSMDIYVLYYFRAYLQDLTHQYSHNCKIDEKITTISNKAYLKRVFNYIKSFKKVLVLFKKYDFDIVVVNNIDTLILLKLCLFFTNKKSKICIEISDLVSHTYTNSFKSKIIRFVEKFMFKYVHKLIVTSPKFYELYYKDFFRKDIFVLENKPLSNMMPQKVSKKQNEKIVIGIVGLLLQGRAYECLFELLKNSTIYDIHIYGRGKYEYMIREYEQKYSNIHFFGSYDFFEDSSTIYSSLDIIYMCYDNKSGSLNNKVALPNKLYESIYFQVPIITSSNTYLAQIVEQYDIGVDCNFDDKYELKNSLDNILKRDFKDSFKLINQDIYIGDKDYIELEKFLRY